MCGCAWHVTEPLHGTSSPMQTLAISLLQAHIPSDCMILLLSCFSFCFPNLSIQVFLPGPPSPTSFRSYQPPVFYSNSWSTSSTKYGIALLQGLQSSLLQRGVPICPPDSLCLKAKLGHGHIRTSHTAPFPSAFNPFPACISTPSKSRYPESSSVSSTEP